MSPIDRAVSYAAEIAQARLLGTTPPSTDELEDALADLDDARMEVEAMEEIRRTVTNMADCAALGDREGFCDAIRALVEAAQYGLKDHEADIYIITNFLFPAT